MKDICPNLHNKQVAQEYGELEDLFGPDTAHLLWSRNNGYSIDKAPNGADSILFGELLHITNGDRTRAIILKAKIYSDEFLKWFGDWTSDNKENVSKVVDKNGEPQATYHTVGTIHNPNFKKFDTNIEGVKTAIYHTDSYQMSATYNPVSKEKEEGNRLGYYYNEDNLPYTKVDYLNIKNPKIVDAEGKEWNQLDYQGDLQQSKYAIKKYEDALDEIAILAYGDNKIDNSILDLYQKLNNITLLTNDKANAVLKRVYDLTKIKLTIDDFQIIGTMMGGDSTRTLERFLGEYDGVIINNVLDYATYDEYQEPHTVYECVDNSQIKSIFNNGQFANPDDMYASPQGGLNMGAATRLSNIPRKGDISILQQYLKSHRNGVSSTALKLVMAAVNRYFNDKQTGITYEIVDNLPGGEAAHYDRVDKVIRINKNANFRNESKSTTPEVQTIVHEMLHAVTEHAIRNDSRIRKSFEDILEKTRKRLGKDSQYYGIKDVYEFVAELSNAQFVETLKSIQYTRKQTLFEKIKQAIKKIYSQIFTSYKGFIGSDNVYEAAVNDLFAVMSHDEQKEDNIVDNDTSDRLASIQASEDKVNQIHHRITELFQGLYKDYKKQLNKGANRQRREDQVWSTIQELKSQEKKESSRIAIQSALKTIGVFARDTINNTILQARSDTILGFLQECQKNNFDSLTAEQIHDMKSNIIDFYNDLVKTLSDNQMDLDARDQADVDTLNATVRQINQ